VSSVDRFHEYRQGVRLLLGLCCAIALVVWCDSAAAQMTIKRPGQRPRYSFELEPHALIGPVDPPGSGVATGLGLGARATIEVAPEGFIPKLNDSVGVGFGLDWLQYDGRADRTCARFEPGPNGTRICTRLGGEFDEVSTFMIPVVMQWNFWLSKKWSVFGEPGLFIYLDDQDGGLQLLSLWGGARFHIQERFTLTARIGHPTFTLGVSFLL
jgi:hypothetical protein